MKTPETPFANVKDGLQSQPQVWEDSTVCMVRTEFDSPVPTLKTKQNLPLTTKTRAMTYSYNFTAGRAEIGRFLGLLGQLA